MEEVACVWSLDEPEGVGWLRLKERGWREPRRARVRVGEVEVDHSRSSICPRLQEGRCSE